MMGADWLLMGRGDGWGAPLWTGATGRVEAVFCRLVGSAYGFR